MADVANVQNIPLQPAAAPLPAAQKGSYLGRAIRTTYLTLRRPADHFWHMTVGGTENPSERLKRIDRAAQQGLHRAKTREVRIEPVAPRLQADLDRIIQPEKSPLIVEVADRAEVGEVANIAPLRRDEEVTRAPQLQQRVDAINWKVQMNVEQEKLTSKLSVFTALLQMRERCGKKDENNLRLMNLVKSGTEGPNPQTVWQLFTSNYDLSFFELIKAAWFYWIYYQSSLITNTVEAYLGSFIQNTTKDLTEENSSTRTLLFRGFLKNVNQFLIEDLQAAKDFSLGKDHGDLEDYQTRAIERHYGFSISELCRQFSEKRVDQDSPQVHILRKFQDIPIIRWAFIGLEWMINKFIIQRTMKGWILPLALESGVNKGLQATQLDNIPFALSLTRFFTERLEQLQGKLEKGDDDDAPPASQFPGTEMLGPTIKNLLMALELEGLKTPVELRRKFAEIEANKSIGSKLEDRIQDSIIRSGDLLFRYLNETAQSKELFARLLLLSQAPFSGEAKEQAVLEAEFREEKLKLERTARKVFQVIVHRAVAKTFNGEKIENSQELAQTSFETQEKIARRSVEELDGITQRMAQKVEQSLEAPTPENNVQTDIASLLQIMQVLATRNELHDKLQAVKGVDQSAVWAALTPLFKRIEQIQEHLLELQKAQEDYPTHAAVVEHLTEITDLLRSIKDQFHERPRHLQNPLIHSLRRAADEIKKCLGENSPPHRLLMGHIDLIAALCRRIVEDQQIIDVIQEQLYPPRYPGDEEVKEGLLDKMLNYQRGVHPKGFRPHDCLDEIGKCLQHFPPNERLELQRIIGNGSNLRSKWGQLGEALQRIYTIHVQKKNRNKTELDRALDTAGAWVQEKTTKYSIVKGDDHKRMQQEMVAISAGIEALKKESEQMKPNLSISWPAKIWEILRTVGPAVTGAAALYNYTNPWVIGGSIAGTVGASALARIDQGFDANTPVVDLEGETSDLYRAGAVRAVSVLGGAGLDYYFTGGAVAFSPIVAAGTAAYVGWNAVKGFKALADQHVFRRVWRIYEKAYQFTLQPRIYQAATTRTMKALSE